jgi:hypothetical protein
MPVTVTPRILSSRDLWRVYPRVKKLWGDWMHIDTGDNFRVEFVEAMVYQAFREENVYCVIGKDDSFIAPAISLVSIVGLLFEEKKELDACNMDFTSFMQFRRMGVARIGKKWKDGEAGYTF